MAVKPSNHHLRRKSSPAIHCMLNWPPEDDGDGDGEEEEEDDGKKRGGGASSSSRRRTTDLLGLAQASPRHEGPRFDSAQLP